MNVAGERERKRERGWGCVAFLCWCLHFDIVVLRN